MNWNNHFPVNVLVQGLALTILLAGSVTHQAQALTVIKHDDY